LLSPEALNVDERSRSAVQKIMNTEPLTLIEYWAVDPSYDGEIFRSVWQDYRGNVDNDGDSLRTVTEAVLSAPVSVVNRRICVRAVDVFGFESEVVIDNRMSRDPFPLATGLANRLDAQIPDIVRGRPATLTSQVTPVTAELLKYWFQQDYSDLRFLNFHEGQRSAVLHIIYAHEVLGTRRLRDLYEEVAPEALLDGGTLAQVGSECPSDLAVPQQGRQSSG
jgi:hypothetical protein